MEISWRQGGGPQCLTVGTFWLPEGRAVLRLVGELDLASCEQLRGVLDAELSVGRAWLVLDMSALTFLDSTGLSVLVESREKATGAGGQLVLAALRPYPAKMLEIAGLDRWLPVFDDAGDAIAALAPAEGGPAS